MGAHPLKLTARRANPSACFLYICFPYVVCFCQKRFIDNRGQFFNPPWAIRCFCKPRQARLFALPGQTPLERSAIKADIHFNLDANILSYRDNLRLVVVHVHTKNPRPVKFRLYRKAGDAYELRLRQVDPRKAANDVIDEDTGTVLAKADLMVGTGNLYEFLPGAEMDDMRVFVLPAGTTVAITAEVTQHKGKPGEDSNSISTVVRLNDR